MMKAMPSPKIPTHEIQENESIGIEYQEVPMKLIVKHVDEHGPTMIRIEFPGLMADYPLFKGIRLMKEEETIVDVAESAFAGSWKIDAEAYQKGISIFYLMRKSIQRRPKQKPKAC